MGVLDRPGYEDTAEDLRPKLVDDPKYLLPKPEDIEP